MEKKTAIKALKNHIKKDYDFLELCKNKKAFELILEDLMWYVDESFSGFLLDKEYLDISWFHIGGYIFDMDEIYSVFASYLAEKVDDAKAKGVTFEKYIDDLYEGKITK